MIAEQGDPFETRYTSVIVNTEILGTSQETSQLDLVCDRLKQMGYERSKRIRIYGQDFEVISNPFPRGNGIAVEAQSKGEKQSRILQLPLPILQMVTPRKSA